MSDRFDDKGVGEYKTGPLPHTGPVSSKNLPMVEGKSAKECKVCGAKYGGEDCPMC